MSYASSLQKLETMTNLMDISREEEQVKYAKQLYQLALEEDEDYYKEAALTEILCFYVNTDAKDSAKVYLAEAERELKGKARDYLVTYMKTIMDVRVVYYTKGEDRMKLIEKYKLRLETEKDMSVLDKIANNYLVGMANSNRVDPKNQEAIYKEVCYYMNNAINGFAELITGDGVSPEEKKEFSKIIYTNCNNITSMMNDVLVIAQLDSSNEVLPLEPVHIDLLCHHEMNLLKKLQQKPDIHYQVEGDKSNDLIYSDANHFGIIISHLLNNANKFTNQGSITLSYQTEEEGKTMCISVTDTGCGIPADKSECVFERFTKNDDFIPGSGLGLYLCRLITQRLNGKSRLMMIARKIRSRTVR